MNTIDTKLKEEVLDFFQELANDKKIENYIDVMLKLVPEKDKESSIAWRNIVTAILLREAESVDWSYSNPLPTRKCNIPFSRKTLDLERYIKSYVR